MKNTNSSISRTFIYSIVYIKILNWLYMQWSKANRPDVWLHDKIMASRTFLKSVGGKDYKINRHFFCFDCLPFCRGNENGIVSALTSVIPADLLITIIKYVFNLTFNWGRKNNIWTPMISEVLWSAFGFCDGLQKQVNLTSSEIINTSDFLAAQCVLYWREWRCLA